MEKQGVLTNNTGSPPPPYDNQQRNLPYPMAGYPVMDPGVEYPPGNLEKVPLYPTFQPPPSQQGPYYTNQPQSSDQQPPVSVVFVQPTPLTNPPRSYLFYAICTTICCCWPIGILAIVRAVECRTAITTGNRPLAEQKSRGAKKWSNVSLVVGTAIVLLFVAYTVYTAMKTYNQFIEERNYGNFFDRSPTTIDGIE